MRDSEGALAQQILDRLQEMNDKNDVIRSEIRDMAQASREVGERLPTEYQEFQ